MLTPRGLDSSASLEPSTVGTGLKSVKERPFEIAVSDEHAQRPPLNGEGVSVQSPIDHGSWDYISYNCATRWYKEASSLTVGHLDHCWYKYKLDDTSSSSDYWAYHQRASFESYGGGFYMDEAFIDTDVNLKSGYNWFDWDPSSDRSGSCLSQPISISYGLTFTFSICEEWDVSKSASPGDQRLTWRAPHGLANQTRELGQIVAVRTPQGGVPTAQCSWSLYTFFLY